MIPLHQGKYQNSHQRYLPLYIPQNNNKKVLSRQMKLFRSTGPPSSKVLSMKYVIKKQDETKITSTKIRITMTEITRNPKRKKSKKLNGQFPQITMYLHLIVPIWNTAWHRQRLCKESLTQGTNLVTNPNFAFHIFSEDIFDLNF